MAEVFGLKQLLEVSGPPSPPQSPDQQVPRAHGDTLSRQDKDSDIAGLTQKAEALEAELQDISSQESKDEASLAKVKKQLRDLEAKVKDQEEELDEQAGTIQMLEQVRRGGARFLGGVVSCRAVITWAGLAEEEEAVALSPASGQASRLPTRLPALRAMARQVTVGRAARPASDRGVYWVSGPGSGVGGCPHVPFALTVSPQLTGQAAAGDGDGAAAADPRQGGGEPRRGGGGDSAVVPEEGRAQLQPLWPGVGWAGCVPMPQPGCRELPAGHHHAAPSSHAATARLHWPGRSDQSLCCLGQRMPGFAPLVAQTPGWWGHSVSPVCGDTQGWGSWPLPTSLTSCPGCPSAEADGGAAGGGV